MKRPAEPSKREQSVGDGAARQLVAAAWVVRAAAARGGPFGGFRMWVGAVHHWPCTLSMWAAVDVGLLVGSVDCHLVAELLLRNHDH